MGAADGCSAALADDNNRFAVLHVAAQWWGPLRPEHVGPGQRLIQEAQDAGVCIDAHNASGDTPLCAAAKSCSGFAEFLLEVGADPK